jgi:hypothetical protein
MAYYYLLLDCHNNNNNKNNLRVSKSINRNKNSLYREQYLRRL